MSESDAAEEILFVWGDLSYVTYDKSRAPIRMVCALMKMKFPAEFKNMLAEAIISSLKYYDYQMFKKMLTIMMYCVESICSDIDCAVHCSHGQFRNLVKFWAHFYFFNKRNDFYSL